MTRRLIDISAPLRADIPSDPPHNLPQIDYQDHHQTAPRMADYMGVRVDQLPDGEYCATERLRISTHNGTHLDAPYHFFSTMNHALKPGGEPSWRIDEVPLEWCFKPAVKLDFRHLPDGYVATPGDVEAELKRIGHALKPLEIVVVNTSAGSALRRGRLRRQWLRNGQGRNVVAARARGTARRNRRMELGRTVLAHAKTRAGDR